MCTAVGDTGPRLVSEWLGQIPRAQATLSLGPHQHRVVVPGLGQGEGPVGLHGWIRVWYRRVSRPVAVCILQLPAGFSSIVGVYPGEGLATCLQPSESKLQAAEQ